MNEPTLPQNHVEALDWFQKNASRTVSWPPPLSDGTLLAARPKGIYKPKWTDYSLSIRQNLDSTYGDMDPIELQDGSWVYPYHQEGEGRKGRDKNYTNRGLLYSMRDKVPVGVLREQPEASGGGYKVLGIGLVRTWFEDFFYIQGPRTDGTFPDAPASIVSEYLHRRVEIDTEYDKEFDPKTQLDARRRILASIVRRQGQPQFRRSLLEAYGERCAMTGYAQREVLEAAHIVPYLGPETNHVSNGLLLRSDIHTLFDLGLITVDSKSMTVQIAPALRGGPYQDLEGRKLRPRGKGGAYPSKKALDQHNSQLRPSESKEKTPGRGGYST